MRSDKPGFYTVKVSSILVLFIFSVFLFLSNNKLSDGLNEVKIIWLYISVIPLSLLPFIIKKQIKLPGAYIFIFFLLFIAVILSGLGGGNVNSAMKAERTVFIAGCFALVIAGYVFDYQKNRKRLLTLFTIVNSGVVVVSMLQFVLFAAGGSGGMNNFSGRAFGPFGNPDILAGYLVFSLPVIWYGKRNSMYAIILSLLDISALVMTQSSSGIMVMIIVLAAILVKEAGNRKVVLSVIISGVLMIIVAGIIIIPLKKHSIDTRILLFDSAFKMGKDNIFAGVGAGNFRINSPAYQNAGIKKGGYGEDIVPHDEAYAHNDYLQMFAETGLFGVILFVLFLIYPVYSAFQQRRYFYESISLVSLMIFADLNFPFYVPVLAFPFFVLSGFVLRREKNEDKKQFILITAFLILLSVFGIFNTGRLFARSMLTSYISRGLKTGNAKYLISSVNKHEALIKKDYQLSFYAGTACSMAGNKVEAIEYFSNTLALFPGFQGALYNLGNAYMSLKQYDKAAESFLKLISVNSYHSAAYNNLGRCYIEAGNNSLAQSTLLQGEKLKNPPFQLYFNLAFSYYLDNNYMKADEYIRKTLSLQNDFTPAIELQKKIRKGMSINKK